MTNRRRAALAILAGGTLALGAPPLEFWPSTFVAIALFAASVDGAGPRRAALSGWLFGSVATLGAFYWVIGTVTRFTPLPWIVAALAYVLLSASAGLTLACAAGIAGVCGPRLGYPIALGLGVLIAERYVPGIFPWQLAAPLIFAPWIRQAADIVGLSGLGALLASTMAIVAREAQWHLARRRPGANEPRPPVRWQLGLALGVVAAAWIYGGVRTRSVLRAMSVAPTIKIALIQPSIPPAVRWDEMAHDAILLGLQQHTRVAMRERPDVVVWSEASYPFQIAHRSGVDGVAGPLIYPESARAPIVVGAVTRDEQGHRYNAALLREIDGSLSTPVAKRVLVPFGEYIPILGGIEWVRHAFARAEGLSAGHEITMLTTRSGIRLGILNCFEDTMPVVAVELASADVLVNITNDAWFGDGAAPWQHLMLARWRAIETRRELVRAVNTGVTCHVDALGRIVQHAPLWRPAALIASPRDLEMKPLAPFVIVYAPPLAFAIVALAAALNLREWRARRRSPSTAA